jgi:hypothetical protein
MTDEEAQAAADNLAAWLRDGGLDHAVADITAATDQIARYCASVLPYWSYYCEALGSGTAALPFDEWREQWSGLK